MAPSDDAQSYVAGTIKRRRRTNAEVGELDSQIMAVLIEDHPLSIRHVFYRMTDPRLPSLWRSQSVDTGTSKTAW